jgi:zinc/manganese transport system permease protein
MQEFLQAMALPFLTCFILAGIHAYLGFHVIERQVVFVDLAMAHIVAVGASLGMMVFGHDLNTPENYSLSLGFSVAGALIFALTRSRLQKIPQEAIIGIIYVVSAATLTIVLGFSGEGDQHIRQMLVGDIMLVNQSEVIKIFFLYAFLGLFHFVFRKYFYVISQYPQEAFEKGLRVRFWDFLFYVSFGIVVTSSVRIVGILLAFSFLLIPAVGAMLFTSRLRFRLMFGWLFGFLGGIVGLALSYGLDLPTGAVMACTLAAILGILSLIKALVKNGF